MDLPPDEPRRRRGLLIVLSSPSGAGKSTISRMLLAADAEISMSVSRHHPSNAARRVRRSRYQFVSDDAFSEMIAAANSWNGRPCSASLWTPKAPVKAALKSWPRYPVRHRWQGARSGAGLGDI